MAQKIWFIHSSNVVHGPFATDTVKEQIAQGKWASECFIWWKGQREWLPIKEWETELGRMHAQADDKAQKSIWYIDTGNPQPVGPLTKNEMFAHLRGITNLAKTRLWCQGMKAWTSIFEMPDVIDELGLSRREHQRAPLMGTVAITAVSGNASTLITKAASISIGGMGLNEAHGLSRGDEVQIVIKSSEFATPLRVQAHVLYVTSKGYAGLKFAQVHAETHALIFDYVKKFLSGTNSRMTA